MIRVALIGAAMLVAGEAAAQTPCRPVRCCRPAVCQSFAPTACPGPAVTPQAMVPQAVAPQTVVPQTYAYHPQSPAVVATTPYSVGRGIYGQPAVYVTGQPVRNFLRYLTP